MGHSRKSLLILTAALLVAPWNAASARAASSAARPRVLVYWDQNEEEDVFIDGQVKQLIPPYDPNGQMCIFPGRSGKFTTGYNPTLPSQNNPGSLKPVMNPPVGEAVWDRHGGFTGKTIAVPGPFALAGSTMGGDIPPDETSGGAFNNNGTYTGCAFGKHGDFFAVDIATAQGQIPVPDSGRLIEWFAPDYTSYCILYGPTEGGVGPHHVDGTGGLKDPGILAADAHGNIYVPESGAGRVLKFLRSSFPRRASDCGSDGLANPRARFEVFVDGSKTNQPFPVGIVRDPTCHCWAVSSVIGSNAVAWYDDDGSPHKGKGPVPGNFSAYTPFGIGVAPNGDVYFVDIHVVCDASGCGPASHAGGIFKVTFEKGVPSTPQAIATGFDFPVSVTICDPARRVCPTPQ